MHHASSALEDAARLLQMTREFTEGFNTGDLDRIMHFYGDTYVDVSLRHPVQSKEQRRAYYAHVAFVRGRIELTLVDAKSGVPAPSELRYLEIVRKQTDGSWKVMWGMDGQVQEYDPTKYLS
jgi:ketosteroid isomerase-like protein